MLSLISQNAIPNEVKLNANKDETTCVEDGNKEFENGQEPDLDAKQNRKRRRERKKKDEVLEIEQERMKTLENVLFGSLYSPIEFGKDNEETRDEFDSSSALFFVDRSANSMLSVYEEDADLAKETSDKEEIKQRKPVWVDEEEEKASINIAKVNKLRKLRKEKDESVISGSSYVSRLRAQHAKLNPGTDWARPDVKDYSSDDEDVDKERGAVASGYEDAEGVDDILKRNEDLVVKSSSKLLPGRLEYSRLADANIMELSNGPIKSVQFHKNAQLLLAAGLDKTLRFFQIDGKKNAKIQSIFLDGYPINKASFLPDGSQVIISGRRKFAYSLDLVTTKKNVIGPLSGREEKSLESFEVSPDSNTIAFLGNEGYILLVSTKTKELIGTLKMNGTVRSVAFTNDGQQLLSSGGDGHIYHWDLRTRTCFHKGVDDGCVSGTALCTSPTGNLFAAGSVSGAVNIYNREDFLGGKRKPLKTFQNLKTEVNFMKFINDSQMLAICSNMKKNSLKLIHVPSFNVFSNWPPLNQALHHTNCLDFSPHGGFMALGNAAGRVLLYKLHHYHNA
ncbi:U3 small nucleolar RNA-associated protein 18-like protein [Abeliophyllum distichum]|uniref:U3 small nucleolar RNA-associated protein 18 homolog n=1 Tax=Abeliophyllum distichum TaxID=126358 RepID=A0ABD1RQV1_9LAMI